MYDDFDSHVNTFSRLRYVVIVLYAVVIMEASQRSRAKEAVTIRLDVESKEKLAQLARTERRTFSSLIDIAVRDFLERRSSSPSPEVFRIRHADLPDTSVLRAFCEMAPAAYAAAQDELDLPNFQFMDDRLEWNRLPIDLLKGESDLVEAVNWLPLFWHINSAGAPPRLDWVAPFLQIFVGHHIFVARDSVAVALGESLLADFERFRDTAQNGRDLSLRSLVAWTRRSNSKENAKALDDMWLDSVVGCQTGTDFHIAVRRVAPILRALSSGNSDDLSVTDPPIAPVRDLDVGFQEFLDGTITAFTGNLLHTAELFTAGRNQAVLLAGPSDLRIPSLNTLALRKGMLDVDVGSDSRNGNAGSNILAFWAKAVEWFTNEIVFSESDEKLREFVTLRFPSFLSNNHFETAAEHTTTDLDRVKVLKSLMQTWVKWFADVKEAEAFLAEGLVDDLMGGAPTARDLAQHYQQLSHLLNPSAQMKPPMLNDPKEQALWPFPEMAARPMKAAPNEARLPT